MAVIGKIRQRSGLLIFLIGLSIVGFLVMDATNSQFGILKGRKDYIGKVNGEKVNYLDFEKKLDENTKAQEDQMRGQPLTDDMRNYLRNQTWNDIVGDIVFKEVYAQTGINVTPEEMLELTTGENASQYLKNDQSFRNPATGQFDPNMVKMYIQNLNNDPKDVEPGTVKKQWARFENLLKKQQYQDKYDRLISKALVAPNWMAERAYKDQNRLVDVRYVALLYSDINDKDVNVEDSDLKNYISENKAKYTQTEESRKIQYVTFDVKPSAADTARTLAELDERRAEFAAGKSVSEDSVFARLYSETPFSDVYFTKENVNFLIADSVFSKPVGTIVGPYVDGKTMRLAKISDRKMISDSVKIRQIKISFNDVTTQEQGTAKRVLVDSLFRAIDSLKADFAAIAATYSDDAVSKMNGGQIGWVKQGEREEFANNLIFYRAQKGKTYVYGSPQENAFFIFQVTEDKPSKAGALVTYLTREIVAGQETQNDIYSAASAFAADNQTEAKFKEAAVKLKLNLRPVDNLKAEDFSVYGLGSARSLVKWAFSAKAGEVSTPITVGEKHVIALLESVRPKGVATVDAVREEVKLQVVREKKAQMLAEKVKGANAGSLDELASKLNKPIQEANRVSFTNPGLNGQFEPKAVAAALALKPGGISKPIDGASGVFVVQNINVTEPEKMNDYSIYGYQMKQQLQGKSRFAQEVHRKLADVEDFRSEFF